MGFFAEFSQWLGTILNSYIGSTTATMARTLEPAVVTLAVLYVMVWGYLQLTGRIEEPLITGLRRLFMLAIILGVALRLWLYNSVIVDTVYNSPGELAAALMGAWSPVTIVDQIILDGADAANLLLQKGSILSGDFVYYIAGYFVYLCVGITAVYTIFLLSLARIALAVLLALGPLFIALLMFESTKRFFEAWLAQLSNFALITILTGLVAALMMRLLTTVAQQASAAGDAIQIAHAVRVCMAAGLVFLVMRQVMPMAASLASGLALSTYGVVSRSILWAFGRGAHHSGQFLRGAVLDRQGSRYDALSRQGGYQVGRGMGATVSAMTARWRRNSVRPAG
jgi:type IV secretion system protein VirB6